MRTRQPIEAQRREEVLEALRHLRNGEDPSRVIERLSQRLTNKLLHGPLKRIHG